MKKTMLVTIDFPPMFGGVANYWANLCKQLDPDKLIVLAPEEDNSLDFDTKQDYLIYRRNLLYSIKNWRWPKWLPLFWHTFNLVRQEKIEIIITTHVLPVGIIAWLIKKILGVDYIVSLHGLDIANASVLPRRKKMSRKILQQAKNIIVNSQYTADLMFEKLNYKNLKKTVIIYPCPNVNFQLVNISKINEYKNNFNLQNKKVILTVGRLIKRKGHDMVLQTIAKRKNDFKDVVYLIVGKGDELNNLKQQVEDSGIKDQVIFLVDVESKELPIIYNLADVFIMTSRVLVDGDVEGFGIVYLEANAYGKPVVAGNCGGAVEAVEHNKTGLLVDPMSEIETAQALLFFLNNSDQAQEFGQYGKTRVEQEFFWEKQAEKLKNIL